MGHLKTKLPYKTCQNCGRAFSWHKKWEKNWHEVKYCSERCRRNRHKSVKLV
ncbi:MAG TPA: DUF2256 domain-containing protein [Cytophagales bacterium]|nr:DUF2256 domain-containing protein [Cytophagales bacterium]